MKLRVASAQAKRATDSALVSDLHREISVTRRLKARPESERSPPMAAMAERKEGSQRSFNRDHAQHEGHRQEKRQLPSASESPDSAQKDVDDERMPRRRKRKPTYVIQKQTKDALLEEVEHLAPQLSQLRRRAGLPSVEELALVSAEQERHRAMMNLAHMQHQLIGSMQSLLSSHALNATRNPLETFIQLGQDMNARHHRLLAMRREKCRLGLEYVNERMRCIDCQYPYHALERYVNAEGDYVVGHVEVFHFPPTRSVRQVYDALRLSWEFFEMAVSEKLGDVTVRDDIHTIQAVDIDEGSGSASNQRLVSSLVALADGVDQEMNVVGFTEFRPDRRASDSSDHDGAVGILAIDSVDVDLLHPYSSKRIRKDVAAVYVVSLLRPLPGVASSSPEPMIVIKKCAYVTIRRPVFDVSMETMNAIRAASEAWGDVLTKSIEEHLPTAKDAVTTPAK